MLSSHPPLVNPLSPQAGRSAADGKLDGSVIVSRFP